jgi:hypothetical protein
MFGFSERCPMSALFAATLSDRQHVAKRRGKTFNVAGDGHADRPAEQKDRRQTQYRQGPGNGRLPIEPARFGPTVQPSAVL